MSILYCLIAKDYNNVLCECAEYTGNFLQISRVVLQKCIQNESKGVLILDKYKIHFINFNNFTFFCLNEENENDKIFSFLSKVQNEVFKEISIEELNKIQSYKFYKGKEILENNMKLFNSSPEMEKETIPTIMDVDNQIKDYNVKNIDDVFGKEMEMKIIINRNFSLLIIISPPCDLSHAKYC